MSVRSQTNERIQPQRYLNNAWLIWLERLGWIIALLIIVFFSATYGLRAELAREAAFNAQALIESKKDAEALIESTKDAEALIESKKDAQALIRTQDQTSWSSGQRSRFMQFVTGSLPPVSATLRFPSLDTSVPIFADESEVAMTLGAAHLADSTPLAGFGNIVLSSHRDGPFRALKNLQIGDSLVLRTDDQHREFLVAKISIVRPDAIAVMAPSKTTQLTLITCFPFYFIGSAPERFVVQATLTNVRKSKNQTHRS